MNEIQGRETTMDSNGYILVYWPQHPDAHQNGYVPRSRLVMENKLGRKLGRGEHVYHLDLDPANDDPDNLTLEPPKKLPTITCPVCNKQFHQTNARIRHCSPECGHIASHRCKHPTKKMLQWMVWDRPTMDVARHFGVSDKAVEKWCKRLGVSKPGRGYWAKVHAGKIKHKNPYKRPTE